ncbi:DUF802 domain-containing protein [Xenophilus sp. Marseille-Q4582]|uniref:DUF802 domain-containing protein n=1 Tax=Xenophilus sp. Marseille-Q4582 TaxID=2866600 RepID=UPI001CE45B1A|nr:DUF802 domain-containing protein [Xenophilus sp. Marseille-Q4582]
MTRLLHLAIFLAGLVAVGWVGAGYLGANPLALAMTLLIAAFYVIGVAELWRFRTATASLQAALDALAGAAAPPAALDDWLRQLPASLRAAARRRVEGERAALPGPALAPYLSGLLVLLGMLGTFIGMVVTLQGTGSALGAAQNIDSIRQSLVAPVQGLGLAFGTSVAGVAASAMLGLLAALLRRERAQAVQQLDAQAATTLRAFSPARQQEAALALLQQQAGAMPALVEQVQALMQTLARQQETLNERLGSGQSRFHEEAQNTYRALAASVDQSLQKSLDHSARVAAEALQPVVQATLAGLAQESGQLQQALAARVHEQLDRLGGRFEATSAAVAQSWQAALAEHQRSTEALSQSLQHTHAQAAQQQAERHATLIDALQARLDASAERQSRQWQDALALQQRQGEALSGQAQAALEAAAARFDAVAQQFGAGTQQLVDGVDAQLHKLTGQLAGQWQGALAEQARQSEALQQRSGATLEAASQRFEAVAQQFGAQAGQLFEGVDTRLQASVAAVAQQWEQALAQHAQSSAAMGERTEAALAAASVRFDALTQRFEQGATALVEGVGARLEGAVARVAAQWDQALARQTEAGAQLGEQTRSALQAASEGFGQQGAALLHSLQQAQAQDRAQAADQDAQRLAAWTASLAQMRDSLQQQWAQAGAENAARQAQICDTLAATAREITAQSEAHARSTIEQIGQLVQAAAEAPRAAADVVAELRQKLSDSMVRDNAMLEERTRILDTLSTLLDAVNHASTEQRGAIDALVSTSAQLMERVGARFGEQVQAQAGHLQDAAAQLQAGTVEIASLGEAFGGALQHFGQGSEKLVAQLARIEEALDASLARSDEQLAYYVAQAREVIDLSVMSQKQIIEDLQQIASRQARAVQAGA